MEEVNKLDFLKAKVKEVESTLYGCNGITTIRRDGNTTRVVDNAIQQLFHGKKIIVEDHCQYGKYRKMNEYLLVKILERLDFMMERMIGGKENLPFRVNRNLHDQEEGGKITLEFVRK